MVNNGDTYGRDGYTQPITMNILLEYVADEIPRKLQQDGLVPQTKKRGKFHALRHSFVTNLLELGVPLEKVSDLVNHADMYFTKRTYGHSKTTVGRDASELYGKAVLQKKTAVEK